MPCYKTGKPPGGTSVKILLAIVASFLLVGNAFADDAPVSPETWNAYQGTTLTVVTHKPGDFAARTAGRAIFAMVGAVVMITVGNKIVQDDHLVDPALAIAAKLSALVSDRVKANSTTTVADQDSSSESALVAVAGGKGLVLNVETTYWGFGYFPFSPNHYRVEYLVHAKLIDAVKKDTIADSRCQYWPDDAGAPTADEMRADHSARLKTMLGVAADFCIAKLEKDMFGVTEPVPAAPPPAATTAVTSPPAPAPPAVPPKTN